MIIIKKYKVKKILQEISGKIRINSWKFCTRTHNAKCVGEFKREMFIFMSAIDNSVDIFCLQTNVTGQFEVQC